MLFVTLMILFSIWDWRRRSIVVSFNNGNPKGTSVTSLSFANEEVGGILIAGSADGNVRLYRNYDPVYAEGKLELVTAWRAVNVMTKVTRGAGIVTDWNQNWGRLLAGGDSEVISVWDATRECCALVGLVLHLFMACSLCSVRKSTLEPHRQSLRSSATQRAMVEHLLLASEVGLSSCSTRATDTQKH